MYGMFPELFIPVSEGIVGRETGFWNHCVCVVPFRVPAVSRNLHRTEGGVSNKKSFLF